MIIVEPADFNEAHKILQLLIMWSLECNRLCNI